MRVPPPLLSATAIAACFVLAPSAAASDGGAVAPSGTTAQSGGAMYERGAPPSTPPDSRPRRARRRRPRGPLLTSFKLHRPRLFLYGRPARVSFRIRGRGRVRVRLHVVRRGERRPLLSIALGSLATGREHSYYLTGREAGPLPAGRYVVRIAGKPLRRAPRTSSTAELRLYHHRFPLVGSFTYGGEDARFGAPRKGHSHQGQDLAAVEGTPIVAPRGGVVETVAYQREGAGHYAVVDGQGEDRDYVFMHMRSGSVAVREGQRVRTGQRIGEVGKTGRSFGAHLHFEIWVGGWQVEGGDPIDPLPLLRSWDRFS